ncbi:hypothetical protein [Actinoplanes sp. M2I2]|uniref:hypothetical protein n=1 Tax=Actinoplanes sp. M2I2 TaxID=1734444 RepID=UPI0020205823|nr:hypothetical protein [Actinoplanes sp. M2I2]
MTTFSLQSTLDSARVRVVAPAAPARAPRRTLLGYLLMPRPKDLFKASLMPLTFGLAALAAGGVSPTTVLRAVVVLAALELLIYPARYQWNDIRGFAADQRHPAEADRGRLPGPLDRARPHIAASTAVAALRLLVAAALPLLLPGLHLGPFIVGMVLGVVGVAIAYEGLRSAATGRSGQVPAPVRPVIVALWFVVGAGYVVRGLTGLALVVDLPRTPALAVAAGVTLWAYGMAFVTSRWAIESTAFARLRDGRLSWACEAGHAREHLLALVRWVPDRVDPRHLGHRPADGLADRPADGLTHGLADGPVTGWAALRGRTALTAPWNLAAVIAGAGAALTGRLLVGPASTQEGVFVALVGGLGALVVLVAPRFRPGVVVAGAVVLVGLLGLQTDAAVVGALPWLVIAGAYLRCVGGSLNTMGALGDRLRSRVAAALVPLARAALGHETWATLTGNGPARG